VIVLIYWHLRVIFALCSAIGVDIIALSVHSTSRNCCMIGHEIGSQHEYEYIFPV